MLRASLNRLALIAPPAGGCVYAGLPPSRRRRQRRRAGVGSKGGDCDNDGSDDDDDEDDADAEAEGLAVYGCYAAVSLCDCRALQALRASLGPLLAERSWQAGGCLVDVVPCLVGDAAISGALQLGGGDADDDCGGGAGGLGGLAAAAMAADGGGGSSGGARVPFGHPHFAGVKCEEHHLASGPSARAAAALFARAAVDHALHLHRATPHLVHALEVLGAPPPSPVGQRQRQQQNQAVNEEDGEGMFGIDGPGWEGRGWEPRADGDGGSTSSSGTSSRGALLSTFSIDDLLTDAGRAAATAALVEAVRVRRPGAAVARLTVLAAVREAAAYVPVWKTLTFRHRGVPAPLEAAPRGATAGGGSGGGGGCEGRMADGFGGGSGVGGSGSGCDAEAYRRVFLTRSAALTWWHEWGGGGDPGQPRNVQHFVDATRRRVRRRQSLARGGGKRGNGVQAV